MRACMSMLRYVPNTPQTEVYDRVRSEAEKVMNSREQNPKNVVAGTTPVAVSSRTITWRYR